MRFFLKYRYKSKRKVKLLRKNVCQIERKRLIVYILPEYLYLLHECIPILISYSCVLVRKLPNPIVMLPTNVCINIGN